MYVNSVLIMINLNGLFILVCAYTWCAYPKKYIKTYLDQWRIQDFPETRGRQHIISSNFPKNCMKLKEFGPPGGARIPRAPLRSATVDA